MPSHVERLLGVAAILLVSILPMDPACLGQASRRRVLPADGEEVSLCLNEVMASNSSVIADLQGRFEDWIELYNAGQASVDAGGLYLTDDPEEPTKWRIPMDSPNLTTLLPGGFLVIWADGDTADPGLHAGFKLDADGEGLYLFASDGVTRIDAVEFGHQSPNISYGRYPDGSAEWQVLSLPTPGTPNVQTFAGAVDPLTFSYPRGFYDQPFEVTIACETADAVIYYTTDGEEPYKQGGRFPYGKVYSSPIPITRTTCLRARAIKPDWRPSPIVTQTYVFLDQVVYQSAPPSGFPATWGSTGADYSMDARIVTPRTQDAIKEGLESLPTMSLVLSLNDLFGAGQGIYPQWSGDGVAWERPASIELLQPDGTPGFQSNCGVRIYGGVGRREKKKSFRLLFKGDYGATKLRYPLFGEDAADEFDTVILRANFNDGYPFGKDSSQYIRDEACRRWQLALGHPSAHGRFVHLYVNGLYWGLYNLVERPDASFAASYLGGDKEDYDAYNSGSPIGATGSSQSWNGLLSAARSGVETNDGYQKLQGNSPDGTPNPAYVNYLDLDSYIDFMIVNFFVGNTDWPGHNWYGAMNRTDPAGFRFFMWDAEWVLGLIVGHGLDSDLNENVTGVGSNMCEPYARMRNNPEFRLRFADRVHRAFFNGGPLYVDPARPLWDPAHPERNRPAALYAELADGIERAMLCESARWGDVAGGTPYTIDQWRLERDQILNTYMVQRSAIVLNQIRSAGLYPSIEAPVCQIDGMDLPGGRVPTGARLSLTGDSTIWYTLDGTDPRVPTQVTQAEDSTTLVPENAPKRVLVPTGPVSTAWRSGGRFNDSAWTAVTTGPGGIGYERSSGYGSYLSIDLATQMYNKQATCYIRIPFTAPSTDYANLLLKIRYDDGFIAYLNGTEVARRNFTGEPQWNSVGDRDNPDAAAVVQTTIDISASLGLLTPGANLLAIHGLNGTTDSSDLLISVELAATKGAPTSTPPAAVSASAVRYTGPIVLLKSTVVRARAVSGSAWSALNETVFAVGPVAEGLRVSEIMYHPLDTGNPGDPNTEYLELTNIAGQSINLNLVRFTKGIDYTFPSFELPPGGYCLIVKDLAAFEARYGPTLPVVGEYTGNLSNGGEKIEIADAAGTVIQSFAYRDDWFKTTDGLGLALAVRDPAAADAAALNGQDAWEPAGPSPGRANP